MLKAVLVDDEKHCLRILSAMLDKYCKDVEVTGSYQNAGNALTALQNEPPDIVFLDIEMPKMTGFDLLRSLPEIQFDVIFTTAYDQYAIDAFKVSAIDYLLKPIDEQELIAAIDRIRQKKQSSRDHLEFLLDIVHNKMGGQSSKIAIPSTYGLDFIEIDTIVYCQSEGNYTHIILAGNKKKLVTRTLKDIQDMLPEHKFYRVHNSYLVNMDFVDQYIRTDGGYLVMNNGDKVRVSRTKKEHLLKKL